MITFVTFLEKVGRYWVFWVLVDVLIFLVFTLLALLYYPASGQLEHYIAVKILDGQIPYVDFPSEYPPLALLSYLLPGLLFRSLPAYYIAFAMELLLFDLLAVALIAQISSRLKIPITQSLAVHTLLILAVGPIITARYDIIPAVLVLSALSLFVNGKNKTAWAVLSLAFMTKLYPIIAVPFFALYHLRERQYNQMIKGVFIFIIVILILALPWLLLDAPGFWNSFAYHFERGLHSESTYGSILLVGKILGLVQVEGALNFGSWNLQSPLADELAGASFKIMAGLLTIVYFLYFYDLMRRARNKVGTISLQPEATAVLLQYTSAAIFIFLLSNKVFSPQYLIWLCPLLPLIAGRWQIPLYTSFLIAAAFSQFVYPYHYIEFELNKPYLVVMMAARNFLILVGGVLVLLPRKWWLAKKPELRE
jgi:uncharacterized membrane protein